MYVCCGFKVIYCSLTCQKLHWFTHEKMCQSVRVQGAHLQADAPHLKEIKGSKLLLTDSLVDKNVQMSAGSPQGVPPGPHDRALC